MKTKDYEVLGYFAGRLPASERRPKTKEEKRAYSRGYARGVRELTRNMAIKK